MKSHNLRHSHFLRILRIHHSKELVTLFISFFFTISWTSSGKTSPRNSWRRRASWTTSGIGKKLQMASPWPLWTMMASCWPLAKPANPWRCAWRARKVKRVPFKPAWKRKAELLKDPKLDKSRVFTPILALPSMLTPDSQLYVLSMWHHEDPIPSNTTNALRLKKVALALCCCCSNWLYLWISLVFLQLVNISATAKKLFEKLLSYFYFWILLEEEILSMKLLQHREFST